VRILTDTGYCLLGRGTSATTWASDIWIGSGITSERAVRAMNLGVGIGVTSKPANAIATNKETKMDVSCMVIDNKVCSNS
jgi:hypothetical protein